MTSHIIKVRNVNHAFVEGAWWLKTAGILENSRNGSVIVAPGPVITEYSHPTERVLFHEKRDANAVFHLIESLWMLAGLRGAGHLAPFNARMTTFAEEDGNIHGAYGHRWRNQFGLDQLSEVIKLLQDNPNDRRVVLSMWDACTDLGTNVRDVPCNTHAYFDCRGGQLNMTVCCRSNDMLWGAYGANAVHFSILQEFIALAVGVPVGVYRQMSNNFHAYLGTASHFINQPDVIANDPYSAIPSPAMVPLLQDGERWEDFLDDCEALFRIPILRYGRTNFFNNVVIPLHDAYLARKAGVEDWQRPLRDATPCDWTRAFDEWVARRNKEQK